MSAGKDLPVNPFSIAIDDTIQYARHAEKYLILAKII